MRIASIFLVMAVLLCFLAITDSGVALVLLWPALSCFVMAFVYLRNTPKLLGKKANGTRSPIMTVILLPYFVLQYGLWHLVRQVSKESPYHEITPGLWLGRRPLTSDLPH